jgi:hypothetical protein
MYNLLLNYHLESDVRAEIEIRTKKLAAFLFSSEPTAKPDQEL